MPKILCKNGLSLRQGKAWIVFVILLFCSISAMAQGGVVNLIPTDKQTIAGDASQKQFELAAPLLYGMPFELSLDVEVPSATSESAPSFNQWGSAILTSGTDPFATQKGAFQIYQRCKGNGGQLVITVDGSAYSFTAIQYSTKYYNVHLIQSNGQLTMEVAAYTNYAAKTKGTPIIFTRSIYPNRLDRLSYAMPSGMGVSNLSLTVRTEDMKNYINNILPRGVGYLSEEAREYICEHLDGGDPLTVYKAFINATVLNGSGDFGTIDGKRSYQLPEIGKVYTIRGVCKDNTYYLKRDEGAPRDFGLTAAAPNPANFEQYFQYLWSPRQKSAENKMALYHATGTGQYLANNGLSAAGTSLASAQEWTLSNGTEEGRIAIYGNFRGNWRYMAMSRAGDKIGDWPSNGGIYSIRQNDVNWSTDFVFEEVPFLSAYELNVTGPAGFDANAVTVRYREKKEGTDEHYTGEAEGIVADIREGGLVFIRKDYEEATGVWRLSISDFTPSEVAGYVAVVTLGSGVINVEYTQFEALKAKAQAELDAAQARRNNFAAGALYSQAAITAAQAGIAAAQSQFDAHNPQEACRILEQTMETFYLTIDGRYVIMENGSGAQEQFISTTSQTNLSMKKKVTDATGNYLGVYQLHYVSGGAYQLRNANIDNYLGQTTAAGIVNSASSSVASRWRGTYTFSLMKTDDSEDAYNIVCTNGSANTLLGVNGTTVAKNATTAGAAAANLWDVRLVDVKTYANAYKAAISGAAFDNVIGHAPSTAVKDALLAAIDACPDRSSGVLTAGQETTLAEAVNHYIAHKEDINKPAHGQYVTFQNRNSTTTYIGENLYEMKATTTVDLASVWQTIVDGDRYYFRNAKTGMYMGKVTQSAIGRLTIKGDGANRQEFDILAAPGRGDGEGYVALHEMGTNNSYSYVHHASSGRDDIVGWSSNNNASHWTINAVTDVALTDYLQAATADVKAQLNTDLTAYNNLGNTPGNYEKSQTVKDAAAAAVSAAWPVGATKEQALTAYRDAVAAFDAFTTAGTPVDNNEMFLIKTSVEILNQSGFDPQKYFVAQVLNDHTGELEGGSLTNGIVSTDTDDFYLFTLWQLVKDGEYYKLYNFYTGHYLSKDVSLSDDNRTRYGLTTNPDDAASFIIKPEHGCFVSFHLSNYDEMNAGYLNMITTPSGSRTMFGLASSNITTGETERMLFELEPATTQHYERCLTSMLDYEIGTGVGRYTDVSGSYATERDKVSLLLHATPKPGDYDAQLQAAAKEFAPVLAGLRINLPEAGKYYRFYSLVSDGGGNKTRYYLYNANPGANAAMTVNAGGDAVRDNTASVFYYDGSHLLSYGNGYYLGGYSPWAMGGIGMKHEFDFANTGYKNKGCYSIKPRGRSYLYNNTTSGLNGWSSAFNERCEWYLEEVAELPLRIGGAGYSTLVSGRNHRIPAGVECYVAYTTLGNQSDGGVIKISLIGDGILPANVPVLVKADAGTYYFQELTGGEEIKEYSENIFSGQMETAASGSSAGDARQYTLQKPSNKAVGFYRYTGATLTGFKSYLDIDYVEKLTGASISSLSFSFEEEEEEATGVREVLSAPQGGAVVYDLLGRRVKTLVRGLYIINGKKYFINK